MTVTNWFSLSLTLQWLTGPIELCVASLAVYSSPPTAKAGLLFQPGFFSPPANQTIPCAWAVPVFSYSTLFLLSLSPMSVFKSLCFRAKYESCLFHGYFIPPRHNLRLLRRFISTMCLIFYFVLLSAD